MLEDNTQMEVFQNESGAMARVRELRTNGIRDNEIYVFSDNPEDVDKLTSETEVIYKSTEGSAGDKFAALFSKESSEEKVLSQFVDLRESEQEQYANALKEGSILLYTERSAGKKPTGRPVDYDKDDGTLTQVNRGDDHDGTIITGGSTSKHASRETANTTPDYTAGRENDRK